MACDDLITNQDLADSKISSEYQKLWTSAVNEFEINPWTGLQNITFKGIEVAWDNQSQQIQDDADALIASLGGIDKGDYSSDPTIDLYSEYVVYDRAGATTGPELWKALPPRDGNPGTPLPYNIDSTTYPHPSNDPNLTPFSDITKEGAEKIAGDGDSQLAGGNIWPLSSQESVQVGDDLTGYDFVRFQGGDLSSVTLTVLESVDGSLSTPSGSLSSYQLTSKPYTCTVGGVDFYICDSSVENTDDLEYLFARDSDSDVSSIVSAMIKIRSGKSGRVKITDNKIYNSINPIEQKDPIELYGSGTLLGDGLTNLIINEFVSLTINGPSLQNSDYHVVLTGECNGDFSVKLLNSKFYDHAAAFICQNVNYTSGSVEWVIYNCDFSPYKNFRTSDSLFDVWFFGVPISSCQVSGSRFKNGGKESLNFQGTTSTDPNNGNYTFTGNVFENYTGDDVGAGDLDVHFIRCYGNRATITGNTFKNLDVTDGTPADDVEAIRPQCDDLVIDGNVFEDAGYDEGWISLKVSKRTIVNNNKFTATDGRNARAATLNTKVLAILANIGTKISNNIFENLGVGPAITMQDNQPVPEEAITIENNKFYDCSPASNSIAVIRLSANEAKFYVTGNKFFYSEGAEKCSACVGVLDVKSRFYFNSNYFSSGDSCFFFAGSVAGISLESKNDTFEVENNIFTNSGLIEEHIIMEGATVIANENSHLIFGSIGGNVRSRLIKLNGTRIIQSTNYTPERFASINAYPDSLLSYDYDCYISNDSVLDGDKAKVTANGIVNLSSSSSGSDIVAFNSQEFNSPGNTARNLFNLSSQPGVIQPSFRDYLTGDWSIRVEFDINISAKV